MVEILGNEVPRSVVILGCVAVVNLLLVSLLWKEFKVSSFDPEFAGTIGMSPRLMSRLLMIAVAVTAVTAFESVGAILVVTLIIVPAAAAYLLTDRLVAMVAISVAIGWASAIGGHAGAIRIDASIAGAMGLTAAALFTISLFASPHYGLAVRAVRQVRRRREIADALSNPNQNGASS